MSLPRTPCAEACHKALPPPKKPAEWPIAKDPYMHMHMHTHMHMLMHMHMYIQQTVCAVTQDSDWPRRVILAMVPTWIGSSDAPGGGRYRGEAGSGTS